MSRKCPMCLNQDKDPKKIAIYRKTFGPFYCRFCGYNKEKRPSQITGDRLAHQKLKESNP